MSIGRAAPEDVDAIHRVHVASIRRLCARSYTPEQIESRTRGLRPEAYAKGMDGLEFPFYEHMGFVRGAESRHPLAGKASLPCVEMTKAPA